MPILKRYSLFAVLVLISLPAWSDDQQKAQKLLTKVSAMATDLSAKRVVSMAVSDTLAVNRMDLVKQRAAMAINYGDVFLAYELVKNGAKPDDLTAQLKAGKNIWQIASDQHADWKQIASDAKKLNSRLDDYLLKHFTRPAPEAERDKSERYDPLHDTVPADVQVSKQDIEDAQKRFAFLHDHAGTTSDATLDLSTEKAARGARSDPVREGGPNNPDVNTRPGPR
jgi:hypothetical protein